MSSKVTLGMLRFIGICLPFLSPFRIRPFRIISWNNNISSIPIVSYLWLSSYQRETLEPSYRQVLKMTASAPLPLCVSWSYKFDTYIYHMRIRIKFFIYGKNNYEYNSILKFKYVQKFSFIQDFLKKITMFSSFVKQPEGI